VFTLYFIVGRLSIESYASGTSFATSKLLATHLHTEHTTTALSLKQLQTELISLSKTGQLDEALRIVQTVQQLNYPLHSNIVCQLLNFSTEWGNKDVFSTALDFISQNKLSYDEQVYTSVIKGLSVFYGFTEAMQVYSEMIDEGLTPRRNLLYHLFGDCLKRNDAKNSCFFFDCLLARSILPPVQLTIEFITLCLNEGLHNYVMKLLEYYSSLNVPLDEELVHHLKWYFEAYNERYVFCILYKMKIWREI